MTYGQGNYNYLGGSIPQGSYNANMFNTYNGYNPNAGGNPYANATPNANGVTPSYGNPYGYTPTQQGLAGAGQGLLGLGSGIIGAIGLSNMGDLPAYQTSPELQDAYNSAKGAVATGYTSAEKAAYGQGIAGQQATAQRNAIDSSGGQLSGAIGGILNAQRLSAQNKFSADDAQLQRNQTNINNQRTDSLAGQLQAEKNMQTQNLVNQYNLKQQAYGGALSSGAGNFTSSLGSLLPLLAA